MRNVIKALFSRVACFEGWAVCGVESSVICVSFGCVCVKRLIGEVNGPWRIRACHSQTELGVLSSSVL